MKAFRLSDAARAAVTAAVDASTKQRPMTRSEEVRALMDKGMKIAIGNGNCAWVFAPRKLAEVTGSPLIAALPATPDVADYLALGGKIIEAV